MYRLNLHISTTTQERMHRFKRKKRRYSPLENWSQIVGTTNERCIGLRWWRFQLQVKEKQTRKLCIDVDCECQQNFYRILHTLLNFSFNFFLQFNPNFLNINQINLLKAKGPNDNLYGKANTKKQRKLMHFNRGTTPQMAPSPQGLGTPPNTHSLGAPEPTAQTAYQSVYPCWHGSVLWPTDRQTDRTATERR